MHLLYNVTRGENAYLFGQRTTFNLKSQNTMPQRRLHGDKELAETAIKNIAVFFEKIGGTKICDNSTLRRLQAPPLSLSECKIALKIIKSEKCICVVNNDFNRNPKTRLVNVTQVVTLNIKDEKLLVSLDSKIINAMRESQYLEFEIITLSTMAFNAIDLLIISLEKQQEQQEQAVRLREQTHFLLLKSPGYVEFPPLEEPAAPPPKLPARQSLPARPLPHNGSCINCTIC